MIDTPSVVDLEYRDVNSPQAIRAACDAADHWGADCKMIGELLGGNDRRAAYEWSENLRKSYSSHVGTLQANHALFLRATSGPVKTGPTWHASAYLASEWLADNLVRSMLTREIVAFVRLHLPDDASVNDLSPRLEIEMDTIERCLARIDGAVPAPDRPKQIANRRPRETCNEAMMRILQEKFKSLEWSIRDWRYATGFAVSTIHGCPAWKILEIKKKEAELERKQREANLTSRQTRRANSRPRRRDD